MSTSTSEPEVPNASFLTTFLRTPVLSSVPLSVCRRRAERSRAALRVPGRRGLSAQPSVSIGAARQAMATQGPDRNSGLAVQQAYAASSRFRYHLIL